MLELLVGSFLVSIVHAIIPNHWAPVILLASAERWSLKQATGIALLAGLAHIVGTILMGVVFVLLGYQLAQLFTSFSRYIAPALLLIAGIIYLVWGIFPARPIAAIRQVPARGKPMKTVVLGLALVMLFLPCLELGAFYVQAGAYGWLGFILVSGVYLVITLSGMTMLVILFYRNLNKLKGNWLSRHGKQLTGLTLITLAVSSFYLKG